MDINLDLKQVRISFNAISSVRTVANMKSRLFALITGKMVLICAKCASDTDKDHSCAVFLCGSILACHNSVYDLSEGAMLPEIVNDASVPKFSSSSSPSSAFTPMLTVSRRTQCQGPSCRFRCSIGSVTSCSNDPPSNAPIWPAARCFPYKRCACCL